MLKQFTIWLDDEMRTMLKKDAFGAYLPMTDYVRALIRYGHTNKNVKKTAVSEWRKINGKKQLENMDH